MPQYAVCFDLDTKAMERDGLTDSEKTAIYQKEIPKAFKQCGLKRHVQYSMYATEDTKTALGRIVKMPGILKTRAPLFVKYMKRFVVVIIQDLGNISDMFQAESEVTL